MVTSFTGSLVPACKRWRDLLGAPLLGEGGRGVDRGSCSSRDIAGRVIPASATAGCVLGWHRLLVPLGNRSL